MRKYILGMLLMISALTGYGKCDWSSYKLYQSNNRNYYKFTLMGDGLGDDTCIGWMYMVYDFQTKKVDTLQDYKGYLEVQFNKKGKYKLYVKIWDACNKCDTAMYREINIQYFNKTGLYKSVRTCKDHVYEMPMMALKGDTCYSYYYYIYSGRFFDNLTKGEWDSITNEQIYNLYDFTDSDLDTFHEGRLLNYTYPKNGRYLLIGQVFNWCNYQDTIMMTKITIDCNSSNVKTINKNNSMKVVGYYDMLGRQVDYMEPDKVYIVLYSNGKRQKVVRTK